MYAVSHKEVAKASEQESPVIIKKHVNRAEQTGPIKGMYVHCRHT